MKGTATITTVILIVTMLCLPFFAGGILILFPLALRVMRGLPAHELDQAVRAPAWLTVAVSLGVIVCALWALGIMPPEGEQVFIGWPGQGVFLMMDSYTLWGCALLGLGLAATSWTPAARRSMSPHATIPFVLVLLLFGAGMLMLGSARLDFTLLCGAFSLATTLGLWLYLFRLKRGWLDLEVVMVLLLSGLLAMIGLLWLHNLGRGALLPDIWSNLILTSPKAVGAAAILLLTGLLAPVVFLPWWGWGRHDDRAMVWLPASISFATAGLVTVVRVLFFTFPLQSSRLATLGGAEQFYMASAVLKWLLIWGIGLLLGGVIWSIVNFITNRRDAGITLKPLLPAVSGLLILAISLGLRDQIMWVEAGNPVNEWRNGLMGMLWMQLAWVGCVSILLAGSGLWPALTARERGERLTVNAAIFIALAAAVGIPPLPGFFAMCGIWPALAGAGVSPWLLLPALGAIALLGGYALLRWSRQIQAIEFRTGAAWGILGVALGALLLVGSGMLSAALSPFFHLICQSLLQAFRR